MFDAVHDTQQAFRKILYAHSRPGSLADISPEADRLDDDLPVSREFLLLAYVLLDGEVTFAVCSSSREEKEEFISRVTYARVVPVDRADFVLVPETDYPVTDVMDRMREGDLVDPHKGATLVLGTAGLEAAGGLILSGPGIRGESRLTVLREPSWIESRNRKNREYPLGVDLLLISGKGLLAALPRTTQIRSAGGV